MADQQHTFIENLDDLLPPIPADSIVSRSVHSDELIKVTLFGFAAGQELSEHTASRPALIQFLRGEAGLTLGEEAYRAGPGTWAHLPANLPHSVYAETEVVMLLTLLKPGAEA